MMSKYIILFFVYNTFISCESAFVETLTTCKKDDSVCHKELIEKSVKFIAKTGIPEIGIPPVDPAPLQDLSIDILDVLNITLIEGEAEGAKDCEIEKIEINYEHGKIFLKITCPVVTVKGKYRLVSTSPAVKQLFNGPVHGEGNGQVIIEKLKFELELFCHLEKRNGDVYVKFEQFEKAKYKYDIKGKVIFSADNLYIGDKESSELVIKTLNENWKALLPAFGKYIADKALEWGLGQVHKFSHEVPVKYFISDDLSGYIK